MKLRLSEIQQMLAAALPLTDRSIEDRAMDEPTVPEREVSGYSIDSRTVAAGDLFFAIRGPLHDGHDYVAAALQRGAAGAVVAGDWLAARGKAAAGWSNLLAVDDPAAALQRLATAARRRWGRPVVGITGSNGKTTTKEAVSALLGSRYRVSKSEGNLNNEYGLPLSLLRIDDAAEIGVLEMGMNHRGEIRRLAAIARPDAAVVTNVNAAHLEFFGSLDEIALAKRELIEGLAPDGTAVLNADDERVHGFAKVHPGRTVTFGVDNEADFQATEVELLSAGGARFRLRHRAGGKAETVEFASPLPGRHNVANVAAAVAASSVFGLEPAALVAAVAGLKPSRMRGEFVEAGGIRILNDCYNANPAAVMAMLEVLRQTPARRRIAVLGEMRELGETSPALHRRVGEAAVRAGIDALIAVQGNAAEIAAGALTEGMPASSAHFFDDAARAGDFLADFLKPGDAVLFKASRAVGLERAIEKIFERWEAK